MSTECVHAENMHKKDENLDISSLEFVRLKIPRLIPRELIDAVKGRTFTPEQFYDYQEAQVSNPANFLYAVVDAERKIHGYLWAETNLLDLSLFVNTFSIAKQFWGKGKGIDLAISLVRKIKEKIKAPRVYWCSTNEKFFLKHGFKRSKICLLEYNEDEAIGG